jgi:hypothetical protein
MFCQWFLQHCGRNPNFLAFVIFMYEAHFTRDGIQNFHNHRLWADESSYAILKPHYEEQFSVDIWAVICGDNLFVLCELTGLQGSVIKFP